MVSRRWPSRTSCLDTKRDRPGRDRPSFGNQRESRHSFGLSGARFKELPLRYSFGWSPSAFRAALTAKITCTPNTIDASRVPASWVTHAPRAALYASSPDDRAADDERPDVADPQGVDARGPPSRDLPHAAHLARGHETGEDLGADRVTIVTQDSCNRLKYQNSAPKTMEVGLEGYTGM